jgi:hypothetical protein
MFVALRVILFYFRYTVSKLQERKIECKRHLRFNTQTHLGVYYSYTLFFNSFFLLSSFSFLICH